MVDWEWAQIGIGIIVGILLCFLVQIIDNYLKDREEHRIMWEGRMVEMWFEHNERKEAKK